MMGLPICINRRKWFLNIPQSDRWII